MTWRRIGAEAAFREDRLYWNGQLHFHFFFDHKEPAIYSIVKYGETLNVLHKTEDVAIKSLRSTYQNRISENYKVYTDNPLYICTDIRYNDKVRYSDNLTVTKSSLKR